MSTALHYFDAAWIQPSSETLEVDLCVYGGTSAGVIAAVTAAAAGRSVVLLQPGLHLGGMTSGGLGWTDYGRKHVIGGRSRQFYARVGRHYGRDKEWRFEPHVAEAVFAELLAEAGVPVRLAQYLDRAESSGGRLQRVICLGGLAVRARQFIDATYEGDLMAKAGVTCTVGRESNDTYGESLNGIQVRQYHQFGMPVDPYVRPGDPSSGLLPQVDDEDRTLRQGQGDRRVQAYNFRICMTDDPALRVPWEQPEGYDPRQYELARRWYAGEKDRYNESLRTPDGPPAKFDILPQRTPGGFNKTDTNNHGPVSSDFIGGNHAWPEADYAVRERLFQAHVTYQKGLYWCLANDPAIPTRYREAYGRWGLARDEFIDTGHWPHQLYVREARRLVGDYVITERDCMGSARPEDPVGMGSYTLDSHNCSRFVHAGRVLNDGDVQVPPTDPYPISYRCLIPRRGECENLLVPICLSASHIAYGSARMEPVFMVLGESAALAAGLAMDLDTAVQAVPYARLRPLLDAAGQILALPG